MFSTVTKGLSVLMVLGALFLPLGKAEAKQCCDIRKVHEHSCKGCTMLGQNLVRLHSETTGEAVLDKEYTLNLTATAIKDASDVQIRTMLPEGVRYLGSEPSARMEGRMLMWDLGNMHEGEQRCLKVMLKTETEGTHTFCSTVHALPMVCVAMKVGRPELAIKKMGCETAMLGEDVTYYIDVTNTGSATARDVEVRDEVAAGMSHRSRDKHVSWDIGDLEPGETKRLSICLNAKETGSHMNRATAKGCDLDEVSASTSTMILKPGIAIEKTGPKEVLIGKNGRYEITVRNTGELPLHNVLVDDDYPRGTSIVNTDGRERRGHVYWEIDRLEPGESRKMYVELCGSRLGDACNSVKVCADAVSPCMDECKKCRKCKGDSSRSCHKCRHVEKMRAEAEVTTCWLGHPAVLIEVMDMEDPLTEGCETTYTIRVTNQGTAADSNIRLSAQSTAQMEIIAIDGPTAGTHNSQGASFEAFPSLEAGESIEYNVTAKALSKGDARFRVQLKTDLIKTPISEEESTHIY